MFDKERLARQGNTLLELAFFTCEEQIEVSEEATAAREKFNAILEKGKKVFGYELAVELENCVQDTRFIYGCGLFEKGWKLGCRPELFAELPEPE